MKWEYILIALFVVLLPISFIIIPFLLPFLLLARIILLKDKYPEIKGSKGEKYVKRLLEELDSSYTVFHDLYVPNKQGSTTQIDHVVTSPFGIFVIETKHYDGWIFGNEKQKYWTQVIYKRKEKFYNPIWQNFGHIEALRNYMGKGDFQPIQSIIAFSSQSTFKFKDDFTSAKVIQFPLLVRVIKEWNIQRISQLELQEINRVLEGLLVHDKKEKKQMKKQHVMALKNNQNEKLRVEKEQVKQNVCPKCGGGLSLKKGKYGPFYGCSNFPKCRYTKQVS